MFMQYDFNCENFKTTYSITVIITKSLISSNIPVNSTNLGSKAKEKRIKENIKL